MRQTLPARMSFRGALLGAESLRCSKKKREAMGFPLHVCMSQKLCTKGIGVEQDEADNQGVNGQ